jgi:hypothetical protein
MVFSFLYWVLRRLLELFVLRMQSEREKEIEISSCATSCTCLSARSLVRSFARLIGRYWPRSAGRYRGEHGRRSSCRLRRCCAGIGSWSRAAGRIRIGAPASSDSARCA